MQEKYYNNGWFGRHPNIYNKADILMRFLRRKAAKKLDLPVKSRVLDIATGTGAQAYEFAKLGHEVIGIDLDEKMLEKAKSKTGQIPGLTFLKKDGTNTSMKSGEFDIAVISFAMHDVPFSIGKRLLREAKRLIKDSGFIYIIDYENPKNTYAAKILYRIALVYESPNYKPFIKTGLEKYIKDNSLELVNKEHLALGAVQLVTLRKT